MKIGDKVVHNQTELIKCDKPVDKFYFWHYFEEPVPVSAGEKIDFAVRIAKDWERHENVCTYYANGGIATGDPSNIDPSIFTLEYGSDSSNGTSVDCG